MKLSYWEILIGKRKQILAATQIFGGYRLENFVCRIISEFMGDFQG